MSGRRLIFAFSVAVPVLFLAGTGVSGQEAPDETKQDQWRNEATADRQSGSIQDIRTAQRIRRAIVDDESLSTDARNVKIFTSDGVVTLKGPVRTEEEKRSIEEKAARIAGRDKVRNEIDIAPGNKG